MPAAIFNLTGQHIIEQGVPYTLLLHYPGNLVGAVVTSEIRNLAGELLAAFTVGDLVYDPAIAKTLIPLTLSATQTQSIPVPLPSEHWRHDVLIDIGGEVLRVQQGKVHVSPEVTVRAID
jgi:hypothetical protein